MANLTETTEYSEGIYRIETTDPVIGGEDGISNKQAKQLANRTSFLKDLLTKVIDGTQSVVKAAKLATARKISIAGAVTGNANFDGSADITINVTFSDGVITINNISGLSTALAEKQPIDATLSALAQVATAANKLIYATGSDTFATTDLTAFMRTLLDDTSAEAARATLGAAPTASPTFTGTVTAPTFSGALNGNAATATNAENANAVNGFGVNSESLPVFAGFNTDGKLVHYSGINLDTAASVNRRCTINGSLQTPTTGFYYLDQYAYQAGAFTLQIVTDLDTGYAMYYRKKINNVFTGWSRLAIDGALTNIAASRTQGVTYTNDSGRTRWIMIGYGYSVTQSNFLVNGAVVGSIGSGSSGNIGNGIFTYPIPAGSTYQLTTGVSKNYWYEYV